jgi:hypothetical protein
MRMDNTLLRYEVRQLKPPQRQNVVTLCTSCSKRSCGCRLMTPSWRSLAGWTAWMRKSDG